MFYKIITGDKSLTAIIIIIIALLIWIPGIIFPGDITSAPGDLQMPLFNSITNIFTDHLIVLNWLAFLFVFIQGFFLVRINTKFIILQKRTFLPALVYFIFSASLQELHQFNGVVIAAFFMIFTIDILIRSAAAESNSYSFFAAGLMIAIGSLFYIPLIYFLIFIWISLAIFRPFLWREYLFPVLGILTPYAFYMAGLFLYDKDLSDFFTLMITRLFNRSPLIDIPLPNKIFGAYLILLILITSVYLLKVYQFRKIYIRKIFQLMFFLFLTSMLVFAIVSGFNMTLMYIISIPLVYLLTNYFVTGKNTLGKRLLLYILILGILFLTVNEKMKWL